jgi:hypothetical protein
MFHAKTLSLAKSKLQIIKEELDKYEVLKQEVW